MTVTLRIPLPKATPGAVSNTLGVIGFALILTAIAFLTSWEWAMLGAGLVFVGMSYAATKPRPQAAPAAAPVKLRPTVKAVV